MKLNLGSGDKKIDGFLSVDYDVHSNPDVLMNLDSDSFPFKNSSVDEVIAHHVLEHLGTGYLRFIKELYRVCRAGALIDVIVPHHRHDNFFSDPTHVRPITYGGLLLFSKKHNDRCKIENNPSSRLGYFLDVDFEIQSASYFLDQRYLHISQKLIENGQINELVCSNNLIEDFHVVLKVIKSD